MYRKYSLYRASRAEAAHYPSRSDEGVSPDLSTPALGILYLPLAQAKEVVLVGTSVRDEDVLLVNSLNLLRLKNQQLKRIVVIDRNEGVAAKVETLAEVETKWYQNLKAYIAR